ncbi:adenosylcobinamide amidohydrolase [Tamaricihabitans halophyticus]|uniref:Adenosylcobinamide amidohydrolase n=1 Tax=Tamaricihabitans halophyticus TaxID=1262583 RepID=A0A4R2R282_9PSEU|nr:adenosylcobinamide amidohydrolase [Tamaricihabitans halophyticus]TCP56127.1 adenosylcobinamide amidohydrolase [Tamaricihabitans halophyticus]
MARTRQELHWIEGYPLALWRAARPWLAISSAVYGGGIGQRDWVLNATVRRGYDRGDPQRHIGELAEQLGLRGHGTGLLTAVDVREVVSTVRDGVLASVTTGVGYPVWAAETDPASLAESRPPAAGTINAVCWSPVRLTEGALVNAVATVAEAKAQALAAAGISGTGTCTDATVLLCPVDGPAEPYGGPRSLVGASLARAVHDSILTGLGVLPGPQPQDS